MNRLQFASLVAAATAIIQATSESASEAKADQTPGTLGQPAIPYRLLDNGTIEPLCPRSLEKERPNGKMWLNNDGSPYTSITKKKKPDQSPLNPPGEALLNIKEAPDDKNHTQLSYISLRPLFLHPNYPIFKERAKHAASLTITVSQKPTGDQNIKAQAWTQVLPLIPADDDRDVQEQSIIVNGLFDNIPIGPYGGALTIEFKSSAFEHQSYVTYQRIANKLAALAPQAGASGIGTVVPALAIAQTSLDAAESALSLFSAVFEALAGASQVDTYILGSPRNIAIEQNDGSNLLDDPMTLVLPPGETMLIFVPGPDPTINLKRGAQRYLGSKLRPYSDTDSDAQKIDYESNTLDYDRFETILASQKADPSLVFSVDADGRLSVNSQEAAFELERVTYITMTAIVFANYQDTTAKNIPPATVNTPTPSPVPSASIKPPRDKAPSVKHGAVKPAPVKTTPAKHAAPA